MGPSRCHHKLIPRARCRWHPPLILNSQGHLDCCFPLAWLTFGIFHGMDDHHSTALRSASSVTDDASNSRDGDQSPLPTLCDTPIHSSQEMEHDISATGTVNLPSSWVKDPGLTPHGAQDEDDGSQISAPSLSGVPPAINLTFASQIVTNPRSVTVRFQPADTHAPATTVLAKQSVFGGIAPYATAFSSSLHEAPEPQPYCAPSVRLHLARYERFWSLNPWDTAHPVTANKVFIFLDSLVLTLGHQVPIK